MVTDMIEPGAGRQAPIIVESGDWQARALLTAQQVIGGALLTVLLAYFLLVSGETALRRLISTFPSPSTRRRAYVVIGRLRKDVASFLFLVTVLNAIVAALTTAWLWAFGVPDPWLYGIIAFVLRFIPYFGVVVTATVIFVGALMSLDNTWLALSAPGGFFAILLLFGGFIEPHIQALRFSLNPVVLFLFIFFWGWIWGPVGVFLAVPLLVIVKVVAERFPQLRPLAHVIKQ